MTEQTTGDLHVSLGDNHIATIELDRPPNNFIDVELATGIADAIATFEQDISCRAIVLVSSGKHFCAGANLSQYADDPPTGDTNPLYEQVARLFQGSVPIIAAVQGAAIGAGLGLALAADFRIACPEARFGATFAQLGFHQGFGLTATLPRVVGEQRASEMFFTGRRVKGEETLEIGLADRLVSAKNVRETAYALAAEIATSAPLAVRSIRTTIRLGLADAVKSATDREHAEQQILRRTDDYREGVAAASERRPPRFTGQ